MTASVIIRSDDLRAENRYRILRTLRRHGPLTRAALGARTGLSQAAISTLIAQLAGDRVLETTEAAAATGAESGAGDAGNPTRRGRPQRPVTLAAEAARALTVVLTIDRLRTALVDYAGTEIAVFERHPDTRSLDADAVLGGVGDAVAELVADAGRSPARIGVAFQGTTDNASGNLLWSPIIGARDVALGAALERRFGAPTSVNNDCALIARALHQQHAELLGPSFATVLFTHGVGMGLTLAGRPFTGISSSALEFGHLRHERDGALCRCGRRGCIEAYAADYGIARLAAGGPRDAAPPGRVAPESLAALVTAARAGESDARRAFAIAGAALGEGLARLFTLLDPMPVALVGRSDEAFAPMADAVREALHDAGVVRDGDAALHVFADDDPLLHRGLALDTLDAVDRQIAAGAPASPALASRERRRRGSARA